YLGGKPLIVRVAERLAPLAKAGALVVVATDAQEVVEACKAHGVEARMTRADHPSGTDRCFEVALGEPSRSYVLNVQGDEPTVDLQDLDRLCSALAARPECRMATLAYRRRDKAMAKSPNVVKVLRDEQGHATYFSRLALPFERDAPDGLP